MQDKTTDAARRSWLFWGGVWLAAGMVSVKAFYLGMPGAPAVDVGQFYLRALAAVSYADVLCAALIWALARATLPLFEPGKVAPRLVLTAFTAVAAFLCLYAVANVVMFGIFGGFLTYPLLALVGDVRMLRSSVTAFLRPSLVLGLISLPLTYLLLVWLSTRWRRHVHHIARAGVAVVTLVWLAVGAQAYSARWTTRSDRAIAQNPPWVFLSSWWRAIRSGGTVQMGNAFNEVDLSDFEPIGGRGAARAAVKPGQPPLNVILLVLESVGARWMSLYSKVYNDTTPELVEESKHGLVFDSFYAHIGRSSNSLVAMLLSTYPRLDFRDTTDEYPRLAGTSIASIFEQRGYHTTFITPSDLSWAGWSTFLSGRGFQDVLDDHDLACTPPLSSWGVEDRCMVDGILTRLEENPTRPFFVMGWTQQTHHPYETTPGIPLLDLVKEKLSDEYDLNRYLNVLHETDRHLGRLFDGLRRLRLDQRTLVVIVGDHGQAFGYPHEGNYMQGRMMYEEDGRVPLMLWYPRKYARGPRSQVIGGHVDLAPTITELAGVPPAAEWQGRSLLDGRHVPRTYFYVAEDFFKLGVRQDRWKYLYDLREGYEELYDLDHDPDEQHNLASSDPILSTRLRQRLAAWAESDRRRYQGDTELTKK